MMRKPVHPHRTAAAVVVIFILFAIMLPASCASGGDSGGKVSKTSAEDPADTSPSPAEPAAESGAGMAGGDGSGAAGSGPAADENYGAEESVAAADDVAAAEESVAAVEDSPSVAKKEAEAAPQEKSEPIYLSADDSNSAASPVIARRLIREGRYVHPDLVRTYEFLNYYSFDYPAPERKDIRIIPQLKESTEKPGLYTLQVAVRSKDKPFSALPPLQTTILLDSSGSMAGESLDLAKTFIRMFAAKLRTEDRLSLVTFDRDTSLLVDNFAGGADLRCKLLGVLGSRLTANDVTNLEAGLLHAYSIAEMHYRADRLNRVVVISDGGANAGVTSQEVIARYAEDSDKQGIYLAGVSMGEGFNDDMMNTLTDRGRGAYLFLDTEEEIDRILADSAFASNFDLAVKNVRVKMEMPAGWKMKKFHGEQASTVKSEVIPQYLAPGDQMIYNMELETVHPAGDADDDIFRFETEYTPIGGKPAAAVYETTVSEMLGTEGGFRQIVKGDALVAYAEMLKSIELPLDQHRDGNLEKLDRALETVKSAAAALGDGELEKTASILETYRLVLQFGERLGNIRDKSSDDIDAALGISPNELIDYTAAGEKSDTAISVRSRLNTSTRLLPMEGYKFVILSSGPAGNLHPAGSGDLGAGSSKDPQPQFMGRRRVQPQQQDVFDLHQIVLRIKAPEWAKSFSFDFNFFSAEYPNYVGQDFNDTFYAILEAESTNNGEATNIAFDSNNDSIEVDNNYFENPFHPIPNRGTGFDQHGSTGWLRTSWPIRPGEEFTLTFSIHDEGDAVYDSAVILDNFAFHDYEAVGTTDPLN